MGGDEVTRGERGVMEDHSEEVAFVGRPESRGKTPTPAPGKGKMTQGLMYPVDALCQLSPRLEAHFTDQ